MEDGYTQPPSTLATRLLESEPYDLGVMKPEKTL